MLRAGKKRGYKKWLDTNKSPITRQTSQWDPKKKKLIAAALNNDEDSSSSSDSDSSADESEQENVQVSQSEDINNRCERDHDQDWINVFLNNENNTLEQDKTDAEEEEEIARSNEESNLSTGTSDPYKQLNKKLCKMTNVRHGEIMSMLMLLGVRHSLTRSAMSDILNLINKLFDEDVLSLCKYKLFNHFPENDNWLTYHICCPTCTMYIGNRSNLSNIVACTSCEMVIGDTKKAPYFLTLNVRSQLKQLFESPAVIKHLQYKSTRQKKVVNSIEDIYDGELYKFLSLPGNVLHEKWNFSYILYTGACQTGVSSKVTAWPVYLKLNELPPDIRDRHMILVGIWMKEEKPSFNVFLQPIIKELNAIATKGVQWKMSSNTITSKVIALCCCVDSECRSSLLNMKKFHGSFGCTFCFHPTETVAGLRRFPISGTVPALRTHDDIIENMIATRTVNPNTGEVDFKEIKGVKGPSILMNLMYFNLSDGMTPNIMCSVYLGVIEQYTNSILRESTKPYYVGSTNSLSIIDNRLMSIKVPKIVTRPPRSLRSRSSWKASEWRSWLLNYSLVCLQSVLPSKYLRHLSRLVAAIKILISDSITAHQIESAQLLLVQFVAYFQSYFGERQMTYNFHLLLHLTKSVTNLGPLHVHDGFCFENENQFILQVKEEPADAEIQIAKRYITYRSVPSFCSNVTIGNRVMEFTEEFENRVKSYVTVDKAVLINGSNYEFNDKEQELGFTGHCMSYKKLIYKGVRYTTSDCAQSLEINDSIIETHSGFRGIINNICLVDDAAQKKTVIFFNTIETKSQNIFNLEKIDHIKECVTQRNNLRTCHPEHIRTQCILMSVNNKNYICRVDRGCIGD